MIVWSAVLPWKPPSINHSYIGRGNGFMFMKKDVKEYKENVAQFARYTYSGIPVKDNLRVEAIFYFRDNRKRDVTNYHKALFDALEGIVYVNDTQIIDVRLLMKKGEEDSVTIKIWTI